MLNSVSPLYNYSMLIKNKLKKFLKGREGWTKNAFLAYARKRMTYAQILENYLLIIIYWTYTTSKVRDLLGVRLVKVHLYFFTLTVSILYSHIHMIWITPSEYLHRLRQYKTNLDGKIPAYWWICSCKFSQDENSSVV
jgi:hypothetical protein